MRTSEGERYCSPRILRHSRARSLIPILQEAGLVYTGAESNIKDLEEDLARLDVNECESSKHYVDEPD